ANTTRRVRVDGGAGASGLRARTRGTDSAGRLRARIGSCKLRIRRRNKQFLEPVERVDGRGLPHGRHVCRNFVFRSICVGVGPTGQQNRVDLRGWIAEREFLQDVVVHSGHYGSASSSDDGGGIRTYTSIVQIAFTH